MAVFMILSLFFQQVMPLMLVRKEGGCWVYGEMNRTPVGVAMIGFSRRRS
jgi:hypothetical protein